MVCDLCNAEGEGTYVNSTLLKVAVANGFNPVTRAPYLASRPDGVNNWRAMVTLDDSDWNLCAACMNAIRPYAVLRPTADVTPGQHRRRARRRRKSLRTSAVSSSF